MTETVVAEVTDETISRFVVSIACGVYLVGYAGYCFGDTLGYLRYLVYAIPPLLIVSLTLQRAPMSNKPAVVFFVIYLLLVSLNYLIVSKDNEFFVRNFIIISLVLMTFVPIIHVSEKQLHIIFVFSMIYFIIGFLLAEHRSIRLLNILETGTGTALDTGYDNNEGGFIGPIYAVFFYAVGAKLQFFLALVMSILGGKRIGLVAILVGLAATVLFRNVTSLKRQRNRFVVLLGILATINIIAVNLTSISEYGYRILNISVHIEEVMLGRYAIGSEMDRAMDTRPLVESLFGSGAGSADTLASLVSDGTLTQPHNDWMKIVYDYGIIGSIIMTGLLALVFSTSETGAIVAIASATIMSTDNVLIYLFYQSQVALMLAYSVMRESSARKMPGRSGLLNEVKV